MRGRGSAGLGMIGPEEGWIGSDRISFATNHTLSPTRFLSQHLVHTCPSPHKLNLFISNFSIAQLLFDLSLSGQSVLDRRQFGPNRRNQSSLPTAHHATPRRLPLGLRVKR